MSRKIVLLMILAIYLSGCSAAPEETMPPDTQTPEPVPTYTPTPEPAILEAINVVFDDETSTLDEIIIVFKNLYPDGIEFDENRERFLLGSRSERTIYQVFDDGTFEPFIEDPDLIECGGLEIDRKNQRLLVTNIHRAENKSYLNSYDLATGERIFISDISSIKPDLPHLAVGIAVDADGNAYVTDLRSPAIYRVDMEGNPTLFMEDPQFDNLIGVVYHPNGFLLLGSGSGKLMKIPLDSPEIIIVDIPLMNFNFMLTFDMIMLPDGTLILVTFPSSKVNKLQSDDDWETALSVGRSLGHDDGYGKKIALRGEEVYILYTHFDRYEMGMDQSRFEIVHVKFE